MAVCPLSSGATATLLLVLVLRRWLDHQAKSTTSAVVLTAFGTRGATATPALLRWVAYYNYPDDHRSCFETA
jgi:hypothetical protein